jgi:hypothetical protein
VLLLTLIVSGEGLFIFQGTIKAKESSGLKKDNRQTIHDKSKNSEVINSAGPIFVVY